MQIMLLRFFQRFGLHNDIKSIADFGFGMGNILDNFVKKFKLKRVYGLEPSEFAFKFFLEKYQPTSATHWKNIHCHFECIDMLTYITHEEQDFLYQDINKKTSVQNHDDNNNDDNIKLHHERREQRKLPHFETRNFDENRDTSPMSVDSSHFSNSTNIEKSKSDDNESNTDNDDYSNKKTNEKFTRSVNERTSLIHNNNNNHTKNTEIKTDPHLQYCYCGRNLLTNKTNKVNRSKMPTKIISSNESHYKLFKCQCNKNWDGSYNLGLFVSVAQYIDDETLNKVFYYLSTMCDFLYFDVVTAEEYEIMTNGAQYIDQYAIHRKKEEYIEMITKYWRIVGNSFLESKFFYDKHQSNVANLLFHIDSN